MFTFLRRLFRKVPERSYALDQLDYKLRQWLDFKRGFFIEAGANDGVYRRREENRWERVSHWRPASSPFALPCPPPTRA